MVLGDLRVNRSIARFCRLGSPLASVNRLTREGIRTAGLWVENTPNG
jgi:hypothetical protein